MTKFKRIPKLSKQAKIKAARFVEKAVLFVILLAIFAFAVLLYYFNRPVKLVDIKIPVATTKAKYYPGQMVGGLFFGEVYYNGRVQILREVFCEDYQETIKTNDGDELFQGKSTPHKLTGTARDIGLLPANAPVGENCVIQFVNTYCLKTPFGPDCREVTYYTQNFEIIDKPADGSAAANADTATDSAQAKRESTNSKSSNNSAGTAEGDRSPANSTTITNNSSTVNNSNPLTNPPVTTCQINLLRIRALCETK